MKARNRAKAQSVTRRGKVLGLLPVAGRYMAVVQEFANTRRGVVVSALRDPASLKGTQRVKASRWLAELGAPPLA
jgi:hypothetical protein